MKRIGIYGFCIMAYLSGGMAPLFAQDNTIGRVSIASPNAASLGKYGDIPVSYHTGIPDISVPIYTIQSGSLKLPIDLSYHASGLKVQEQASWVGAGWTLNAGGAITRTVVGAPDDRGINAAHTTFGHFSDYGYNSYLFSPGGGACGQPPCPTGATNPADDNSFSAGVKDGEPDLFFFNFNGHTGKFYFNDDRTPIIVPKQDLKIVPVYPYTQSQVSPYGILGFTITTPDGDVYYFGQNSNNDGNIDAMEITTDMTSMAPSNTQQGAVSSWFLNKIVSADRTDSINLVYQQDNFSYYSLSMFPVYPNVNNSFNSSNYEYDLLKNFIRGVRLSKITFPNGEVDFNSGILRQDVGDYNSQIIGDVANTQSPALGSIVISDNKGFCKKDNFYYSYFQDNDNSLNGFFANNQVISAISSDKYRLRLDSVSETSCDGSLAVPPYKFSYFTETVPRKLSFGLDHWGFYNGVTTNQTLIPTYTVVAGNDYSTSFGADRDAHWPAMRGGTLQQITYPTGGFTSFEYEPNDTYTQYSTRTKAYLGSFSVGYGNEAMTGTFTTDAMSTSYELDMTTSLPGAGANLQISNPQGTVVVNQSVTSGSSVVLTFILSPSTTYTWVFRDNGGETSDGASAGLYKWTSTSHSGNVLVGGLRIKTVTSNDGLTNSNIVTSYAYNYGGTQSSGILYSRPVYVQTLRNDIYAKVGATSAPACSVNGCVSCDGSTAHAYYRSPSSIRPMATTQGNHIGYNQVQVSQSNNGYSIYRYYGSNTWDNNTDDVCTRNIDITPCSLSTPSFPAPPMPFEFMRGELKYEGHFNQDGHVLRDATYFPTYVQDSVLTPGYTCQIANIGSVGSFIFGAEYYLQSAKKIKDSVVSTDYDPVNSSAITNTAVSYYSSPFHRQVTRKVAPTSTGDSIIINYKYASDFRIAFCDTISDGWEQYFASYVTDSLSFINQCNTCTNTNGWNCKWLAYQQYRYNKAQDRQSYVTVRRANYSDPGNRYATCYLSAEGAADVLLKPILRLQDIYLNAPVEMNEWKNTNLRHSGLILYGTAQNSAGFPYPVRSQSLNLQALSSTFTVADVAGNTLVKDSRYLDEAYFLYSAGNPQQRIAHDGLAFSYIWDYNNLKPVAEATNATVDQIAYTSFESNGSGSWVVGNGGNLPGGVTGDKYHVLSSDISRPNLNSGDTYIVSYWTANSASYTIPGTVPGYPLKGRAVTVGATVWTYYEHKIGGQSIVQINGSGGIDELRLYPANAQMKTYTYSPMIGMTSQCDVNNRILYYENDGLGRLKQVRDQDRNVIKTIDYHYKGQ